MSRSDKEHLKVIQDKCVTIITQLLKEEDNKYCVDCDAKGPRWASWNLGIFLCIRCAGIHRNLGVHISRVKSVNLDTWTPEQVGSLQQMGNSKGRAVYEANLPDNFRRPTSDSSLEVFIRAKYEHKKYIAKEWVPTSAKPAFNVDELKKKDDKKKSAKTGNLAKPSSAPVARPKVNTTDQNHTNSAESAKQPKSANNDLLGLDVGPKQSTNQDDMFGLFVSNSNDSKTVNGSAPQSNDSQQAQDSDAPVKATEEDDFFKQSSEPSKKMTKESILSLYSTAPVTNNQQPFGMPGGMYVGGQPACAPPQQTQNGLIMASGYPAMQNGMMQNQYHMAQPNLRNPTMQQPQPGAVGNNPFMGNQAHTIQGMPGNFAPNPNVASNTTNQMFVTNNPQQQQQQQLQHQMASMQVSSGQPPQGWAMNSVPNPMFAQQHMWTPQSQTAAGNIPTQGQTLSNNLWK